MSKNILCIYLYTFLFVLLFSNYRVLAQSVKNEFPKPTLSFEMDDSYFKKFTKSTNKKLADFRGLILNEIREYHYYHLLNYIFFDEGKSEIPSRYFLYRHDCNQQFNDSTILGSTLDKYYHILNIYGFRLIQNPKSKIKIIGCNDNKSKSEIGNLELSKARATSVYNYLKNIWKIDTIRMKLEWINLPTQPTNSENEILSMQENRRVEIICDDWEIVKPIYDCGSVIGLVPNQIKFVVNNGIEDEFIEKKQIVIKQGGDNWVKLIKIGIKDSLCLWNWKNTNDKYPFKEKPFIAQLIITTKTGEEIKSEQLIIPVIRIIKNRFLSFPKGDTYYEDYNIILFQYDLSFIDQINKQIINTILLAPIFPSSVVTIYGHSENEGNSEHSMELSERRAKAVGAFIEGQLNKKYKSITTISEGEEYRLYNSENPEGRFYNRTVQLKIETPLSEFDE